MRQFWMIMVLLNANMIYSVFGHGRLTDPPSRASAWRFGFNTPKDYNDHEGFCGGFSHQWYVNGGACGICGDAWDKVPRAHEKGGTYATGKIVKHYLQGQEFTATVDVTANHRGFFEFRICPTQVNDIQDVTQTCLNYYPLPLADLSGYRYYLNDKRGNHHIFLLLPKDLTCKHCVLQWRYVCGNNWGTCSDGKGEVGCGPQEEFRACADIAIDGYKERIYSLAQNFKSKIRDHN